MFVDRELVPDDQSRLDVGRESHSTVGNFDPRPHSRAAQKFTARSDVGTVTDDTVTNECAWADTSSESDYGSFHHSTGLDHCPVEHDRAIESRARADFGTASDYRAAYEERTGSNTGTRVHERFAACTA